MTASISFRPYHGSADSTVVGDVRVSDPIGVEYLDLERELLVYLPPGYTEGEDTYPVVYAQDGQNVFDEATSNDGEWDVDETMESLAAEGIEAIVVAIPNAGEMRAAEYAPFFQGSESTRPEDEADPYARLDPLGEAYAEFLAETVVPLIDERFRTREDPADRGLLGSSMGGLISLYTFFAYPERFGFVGAMSPAVGGPWAEVFEFVETVGYVDGDVYVDVGTEEFPDDERRTATFLEGARRLVETLEGLGYDERLRYVEETGAIHHEDAWARRFPDAIRFLLG